MAFSGNIDYKRLNDLVSNFVSTFDIDKDTFAETEKLSIKILKEQYLPTETDEWSRDFSLNETVDIVYEYLDSFDHNMAIQYNTLLHQRYEDGTLAVNFVDGKYNPDEESYFDYDQHVQFVFFNNPLDVTTLLHEMIHMMNSCKIEVKENIGDYLFRLIGNTETRVLLGESASITFELLLSEFMLEKGYITENDYNLIYNDRLDSTKGNAEEIIVLNELIKLYLKDNHIDFINLTNLLNSRDRKSIVGKVLRYEYRTYECLLDVLDEEEIFINELEKYVLGFTIAKEILKDIDPLKETLWLHDELGNVNSNLDTVIDDLNRDLSVKIR